MKTAIKLTIGTLTLALTITAAFSAKLWGQNPDAIDNARSVAKSLQQKESNNTNAAGAPAAAKPAAGAPAPAVKPAEMPAQQKPIVLAPSKPASTAPAPTAKAAAPKSSASSGNRLQKVNVVPGSEDIQIEISSSQAVSPNVSKLSSPARILVELPETTVATAQNKIPVGSGGVKGVRIGMDGKNPPTTSVVIDLEKAITYDVAPGPAGKLTLVLHTQGASAVAKSAPAAPAPKAAPAKAVVAKAAPETKAPAAKPAESKTVTAKAAPAPKSAPTVAKTEAKKETKIAAAPAKAATVAVAASSEKPVKAAEAAKPKEEKHWAMNGKRDPFFSPVVQEHGSGCSTGKKCLDIGNINLRGVVKSDNGFIAVVTNNIGKAYFLRENDPVFNGYVVRITGDSVVFEETVQDKLGKTSTHEVVKKIFTPAV